ncbi:MAG: metallopeptidase [Myxococcales bacterium]|nr:metallopeptidase [Myxococcales bacterium]
MRPLLPIFGLVASLAACGGGSSSPPDAAGPVQPVANPDREVIDTKLSFDVTAMTGQASITLDHSTAPGASFEVGDLHIDTVTWSGADLPFAVASSRMDLGLPRLDVPTTIDVAFHWSLHSKFDGESATGFTFLWPYFCGNLFPCHSQPSDGTTFTLDVTGVPAGKTAVFPPAIPASAPAYQLAWSIDAYTQLDLGATTAGTQVSVWYRPNELTKAMTGTQHLVAAFDWLEKTLGPYRFGDHVGTVSVAWGPGAYGGMEHHPRWHVGATSLANEVTNVHESAHGWFGDGIRLACWEDFVLSEGTVSYLAARALDVVAPAAGAQAWSDYASQLAGIPGSNLVWPQTCGKVDVLKDHLFTNAPYMRGAFFYKAVADKVGAGLVDRALSTYYLAHAGATGSMAEMLETIHAVTGYDPGACAQIWLTSATTPQPGACP